MPTTKPIGPGTLYAIEETTAFTPQAFLATSAIRHLGIPSIGDSTRERIDLEIARKDRGRFHEHKGRFPDVEFSVELPFFGRGAAGTELLPRSALLEAAAGLAKTTGASIKYATTAANPAKTASLYYVDREGILGQYLAGCIATAINIGLTKTDTPKITVTGKAARKWEFSATTLGVALASVDGTECTLTDAHACRDGSDDNAISGLPIFAKIDSEIIKITAFNRTTKAATIVRGQFSTSGATHLSGAAVTPYNEAPTFAEAGIINGPHEWSFSDGATRALTKIDITINTGREFDPLSSGSSASSALHNGPIDCVGSLSWILDTTRAVMGQRLDIGTLVDAAIVVGATAGSIFTINADYMRLIDPMPKALERGSVAEVTQNFRLLDTATALGQIEIIET